MRAKSGELVKKFLKVITNKTPNQTLEFGG